MPRFYSDEVWKDIPLEPGALRYRYAVSNYGRIISYTHDFNDARILRGGNLGGYPTLVTRPFGKSRTYYIHKLMGELFLKKRSAEKRYVIHYDHNKTNNHISNLRWATKDEMEAHQQKSPLVIKSRKARKKRKPQQGHKLSSTDVIRIKKKIFDPNRRTRMKIIARQFGISEMQLYRIKSGENWGHVKVDNI